MVRPVEVESETHGLLWPRSPRCLAGRFVIFALRTFLGGDRDGHSTLQAVDLAGTAHRAHECLRPFMPGLCAPAQVLHKRGRYAKLPLPRTLDPRPGDGKPARVTFTPGRTALPH